MLYASTAFESAALLPCLASSIVAYSTFALFITPQPIFILPDMSFRGLRELPLFMVLTLVCAGVGWLYVRVFYGLRTGSSSRCRSPGSSSRRSAGCCWESWPWRSRR